MVLSDTQTGLHNRFVSYQKKYHMKGGVLL